MNKKLSLNIVTSLALEFVVVITGFVIPRLILNYFGSEVNGLVSSINQLLSYVNLLEGGVASVIMANLYKPLYEHDNDKLSRVIKTSLSFFRKIGLIFIVYLLTLSIIYPLIISTDFNYDYIFSLTIILGINTLIQYVFSYTNKLLLNSDNKLYITNSIQVVVVTLNAILIYLGLKIFPNIHFVKLITASVYLIQPICYKYYVNKHYSIKKDVNKDLTLIDQRWDGFGINLAAFIHNNTDIVILTALTNLKIVSVYSVYMLVIKGVKSILLSFLSSFVPMLGKTIAREDAKELNDYFDKYEFVSISLVFILFNICALLIVPFVMLYTENLTDVNYYQPIFAFIILFAEVIYCIREPYVNLAYQSGHFRQISKFAYIEAIINIVLSVIFVLKMGLLGVALGTLISMTYRTICQVVYIENNIIFRSRKIFFKYVLLFLMMPLISYLVINSLNLFSSFTFLNFIILTFCSVLITILIYTLLVVLFFRDKLNILFFQKNNKIKKRKY